MSHIYIYKYCTSLNSDVIFFFPCLEAVSVVRDGEDRGEGLLADEGEVVERSATDDDTVLLEHVHGTGATVDGGFDTRVAHVACGPCLK